MGTCRQVQADLSTLLEARLAQADRYAADLTAFRARLGQARTAGSSSRAR